MSSTWTLSGFGDEIADDLDEQLDTLQSLGIQRLDLRAAWGLNVMDLSADDLAAVAAALQRRGMTVSCVASPIGKAPIADDFAPQLAALQRALSIATLLGTPYVRVFSWYIPAEDDAATYRDEVLHRFGQMARQAEATGITLLHENERGIFGDSPDRCRTLLSAIDSPCLRAVWEPSNFVSAGFPPHPEAFEQLRPWLDYVHVKDTALATRAIVVAGAGDADWPATLAGLRDTGYAGNVALEPHLQIAGAASGFSGPDLFGEAAIALQTLAAEYGIDFH